jgi:hypothetical protein
MGGRPAVSSYIFGFITKTSVNRDHFKVYGNRIHRCAKKSPSANVYESLASFCDAMSKAVVALMEVKV